MVLGPNPRVSDSVNLGRDPRICISDKFLGNAGGVSLGTSQSVLRTTDAEKKVQLSITFQFFREWDEG